jgi:hypothetical protein
MKKKSNFEASFRIELFAQQSESFDKAAAVRADLTKIYNLWNETN